MPTATSLTLGKEQMPACSAPNSAPVIPAAGADPAEQDRHGNDGERILPRQESDENAGKTISGGEVGVGAALHGGDLDHAGKAGCATGEKTNRQDQLADAEANDLRRADI